MAVGAVVVMCMWRGGGPDGPGGSQPLIVGRSILSFNLAHTQHSFGRAAEVVCYNDNV